MDFMHNTSSSFDDERPTSTREVVRMMDPALQLRCVTRRRRLRPWNMTTGAFAATTFMITVSMVAAFLPSHAPFRHSTSFPHHARPRGTFTEIDTPSTTRAAGANDDRERLKLEQVYLRDAAAASSTEEELLSRTSSSRIRFKGLTTTRKKVKPPTDTAFRRLTVLPDAKSKAVDQLPLLTRTKRSTMPGFDAETVGQRAYKDSVRHYERRTGRKHSESPEEARQRSLENGSKMYINSANAPESLVRYSKEIQRNKLLTHREEQSLGKSIQEAIRLQRLHDLLEAKLGREPTDSEWCAASGKTSIDEIEQHLEHGRQAKNDLVVANIRLVQKVVNTYIRNGLTPQYNAADMMQEGTMALIRAAEKYEPDRGWKFSTYGMYWIRSAVKESQVFQSRLIPLPQKLRANSERLVRLEKQLFLALGRWPTRRELSKALGLSEHQVDRCYHALSVKCYSLDEPTWNVMKRYETPKGTMADEVGCRLDSGNHGEHNRDLLVDDITDALKRHLESDEVELLLLRYGLKGRSARTGGVASLRELSAIYGVSVQKISTTLARSLKRLQSMEYKEWAPFM